MASVFSFYLEGDPATPDDKVLYRLAIAGKNQQDPLATLRLARKASQDGETPRAISLLRYVMDVTSDSTEDVIADLARYNAKFHLACAYYDGLVESTTSSNVERGIALIRNIVARPRKEVPEELVQQLAEVTALEEVLSFGEILRSAQFNLGSAYMTGVGAIKNEQMALGWFQKGAKNGCHQSMSALGQFYSGGSKIDPIAAGATSYVDLEQAKRWHTAAAELGNAESMAAIGTIHGLQAVANKDSALGLQWLKCGANCGSIAAQAALALLYYRLHFYNKSVQWTQRIAALEAAAVPEERKFYALGCWLLGRCHELGRAVDKSREQANALYSRATASDIDTVKRIHGNPEF